MHWISLLSSSQINHSFQKDSTPMFTQSGVSVVDILHISRFRWSSSRDHRYLELESISIICSSVLCLLSEIFEILSPQNLVTDRRSCWEQLRSQSKIERRLSETRKVKQILFVVPMTVFGALRILATYILHGAAMSCVPACESGTNSGTCTSAFPRTNCRTCAQQ